MRVPSINSQQVFFQEQINPVDAIIKIYPDINPSFFKEGPNIYDKSYISGITRELSEFTDGYTSKKIAISHDMKRIYSNCLVGFSPISRNDANTSERSWLTVISGRRPMGQFSVDSLYSPELHALLELPNIDCKIFPKENNEFLYMVFVYRSDCEQGERYANRFIELYKEKRRLMDVIGESHEAKAIKSEIAIAREMESIFNYLPEEIDDYMHKLNSTFSQLKATSHNRDKLA
ncbi:NleE/OspZ family T3SS effector cysteine methyltransferase [Citrobacter portucalensis]|uniref:NleE/OspZ family T3SS effector cysteine methyltransferase n=1 Tax=Citrobacter portucalensis TaxID=1639133 RepID=UPI00226B8675|nr:NleE/OspZ family T3SS effector cysteine methyltransferase [Citrobacter portucalensis]MCX8985821.1 NleE/OspZ family T3SS effector cysteine methyltransferase [Citrobacter portucalensis]